MNGYVMSKDGDKLVFEFSDYEQMRSFLIALGVTTIYFADSESGYKVRKENFQGGKITLTYETAPLIDLNGGVRSNESST